MSRHNATRSHVRCLLSIWYSKPVGGLPCRWNNHYSATGQTRWISNGGHRNQRGHDEVDLAALLAKPTWSVSILLPPQGEPSQTPPISSKQLHHLLRLSALPPPSSVEEEKSMMDTLAAQLHFVREMQKVDTMGVEPLRAIRDETKQAQEEQEITLDTLKDALAKEKTVGKHYKRIRRQPEQRLAANESKGWDPLSHAQRKAGKYFVVDSSKTAD